MRPLLAIVLFGCVASAACKKKDDGGPGDTTEYTVTSSLPRVGVPVRMSEKMELRLSGEARQATGQSKSLDESLAKEQVRVDTTLAAGNDGAWTKRKIRYEKYTESESGKPRSPAPPTGKSFVLERAHGALTITTEKGEVTAAERALLNRLYGGRHREDAISHRDFLPEKPVRIGEAWKPNVERLGKSLGNKLPVDGVKATASARLARVYDRGGHRFGIIDVKISFPVLPAGGIPVGPGSRLEVTIHYDGCIDGSICAAKMTGTIKGRIEADGPQGALEIDINGTIEVADTELSKD